QVKAGIDAINAEVDINIACSLGMLTQAQVDELRSWGVHRYNHNLESARSYFGDVVTTHSFEERWDTCLMVKESGMELCCGGLVGGINAVIVGNYLTTLGRPATADLDLLAELKMPVKELQKTL